MGGVVVAWTPQNLCEEALKALDSVVAWSLEKDLAADYGPMTSSLLSPFVLGPGREGKPLVPPIVSGQPMPLRFRPVRPEFRKILLGQLRTLRKTGGTPPTLRDPLWHDHALQSSNLPTSAIFVVGVQKKSTEIAYGRSDSRFTPAICRLQGL